MSEDPENRHRCRARIGKQMKRVSGIAVVDSKKNDEPVARYVPGLVLLQGNQVAFQAKVSQQVEDVVPIHQPRRQWTRQAVMNHEDVRGRSGESRILRLADSQGQGQ